jgi:CRP/FNR family transcriptional regulator, anaerobic regulatory protein
LKGRQKCSEQLATFVALHDGGKHCYVAAMSACDTCVVRNRAICAALDNDELFALNTIGRRRNLTAGESLMWEGEDSVLVANVIEGVLKLSTGTEDGREQIVGVVYPSDFIGRPFGSTTGHGVTALTDSRVCVFSRRDFDAFAREHPALEHKLLQRTLGELDRTRRWMLLLGRKSAGEKLATFLLDMSERLVPSTCADPGESALRRFTLPFSRQQVADVLGLTIETVSRQFTRLKAEGVIDLPSRREVQILNREALVAEAG